MSKSRNLRITFSTMCHFKPNENDQKSAKNKLLTFFVFPLQMAQMKVHKFTETQLLFSLFFVQSDFIQNRFDEKDRSIRRSDC